MAEPAPRHRLKFLAEAWHLAWPYYASGEDRWPGRLQIGRASCRERV